ncbi:O-linked N-acetylglucosamine transferase, SPINDLY family protein [Coleofasciculus sp. FACHB-1120]|uniref:O-linked N-acetylglucosamine transferase, SPINDLY family protein n=1 Tax=Coleofasciculus sp. FACHB-1120 TaxID=2692783 RepID=UPI00168755F3|nr:O-linked N-acetylglucosamine transferase, SPINDLY family protein [Coleofasciculus sp. FACHB-1120]MBD2744467.1 O-linked N-acetylglucosamine transferase, SPINDLY family protein [Coleofasciculus sp. FACHB-1120]
MTFTQALKNSIDWQQQAHQYLVQGLYGKAANLYEEAISVEPDVRSYYWHLGLMLLLQAQEAEAQTTWLLGMGMGDEGLETIDLWTAELVQILETEAERRESLEDYKIAWVIRQHIREIAPRNTNNLLRSFSLSIQLETFTGEDITESGIIELLKEKNSDDIDINLLLEVLESLLSYAYAEQAVIRFAEACINYTAEPQALVDTVMYAAIKIAYSGNKPHIASRYAELCLDKCNNLAEIQAQLTVFYQNCYEYDKGIDTAKSCYELAEGLHEKVYRNYLVIRALMSASGYWEESCSMFYLHRDLMFSLIEEWPTNIGKNFISSLFVSPFFSPYFKDDLPDNRLIQNKIARLCYENYQNSVKEEASIVESSQKTLYSQIVIEKKKILKIGYVSQCLRRHSVGWISRWLFEHHDRERFQIHTYLVGYLSVDDFTQRWFVGNSDRAYRSDVLGPEVLKQIDEDELDILVDLDSITSGHTCEIFAKKSAPVQVSWLGWDASGLPSIDYFIADPYVLPDYAQEHYTEMIWRLPNTYVAVDGFEVAAPTLRRDQLDIPNDAVVYFVAQKGYKRNPDNVRLQMKILKEVPNSYFLIKGPSDEKSSRTFFGKIAQEEGVNCERLKFMPIDISEEVHRANLGIADVVLDTYPYNGATTTLETLWMCIPLVTRVGEQFSARNSYGMMMNAGITEGIAWTDEEYIEWGVRLGKDAALRQQVAWKLKQSRQTAPLWNAKQFTREMEKAYEQMWEKYTQGNRT